MTDFWEFEESAQERRSRAKLATPWAEAELRACVAAYRRLLDAQEHGEPANKSELRRKTMRKSLPDRSEGSFEFRMQNISAVLEELGLSTVTGYLPRRNVGAHKRTLVRFITEIWDRQGVLEERTEDQEALHTRVQAARGKLKRGEGDPPLRPPGSQVPPRVEVASIRFLRDPNVIAWVLEIAGGTCEVCKAPAPFRGPDGDPYLEIHHVRPLSEGGPDTTDNVVAGCPNCHRRLHHAVDRNVLRHALIARLPRLRDYPRGPPTT